MPRPFSSQAFSWPQRRHENPCGQRCSKSAWRQSSSVGYISMKSISVFGCRTIFASLWVAAQEATGGTGRKGMVMRGDCGRCAPQAQGDWHARPADLAAALGANCRGIFGSCLLYDGIEAVENQRLVGGCIMHFLHSAFGRPLVVGERLANVTRDHR